MKWLDNKGIPRIFLDSKYRINWGRSAPSKGSQEVKDFLKKYLSHHAWYEEYRIPRTRLKVDFLSSSLMIAIEFHGKQHDEFVPFMHGSKLGYFNHMKRDFKKMELLEKNGIKLIEIRDEDLPLTKSWFKTNYNLVV